MLGQGALPGLPARARLDSQALLAAGAAGVPLMVAQTQTDAEDIAYTAAVAGVLLLKILLRAPALVAPLHLEGMVVRVRLTQTMPPPDRSPQAAEAALKLATLALAVLDASLLRCGDEHDICNYQKQYC
jgi:hypothetical protein